MDNNKNFGFEPSKPFTEQNRSSANEQFTSNQNQVADTQINQENSFESVSPYTKQNSNFNSVNTPQQNLPQQNIPAKPFNEQALYSGFDTPYQTTSVPQMQSQPMVQNLNYTNNNGYIGSQVKTNVVQPFTQQTPQMPNANNMPYNQQLQQPTQPQQIQKPQYTQQPNQYAFANSNNQLNSIPPVPNGYPNQIQNQAYPQGQQAPFQQPYSNSFQPQQITYGVPQMQTPKIKQKTNVGAIIIIIVLSLLFVGSIVGMVLFDISNNNEAKDNNKNKNENSYSTTVPDDENSTNDEFKQDNTNSNYSNQVKPNYDGLTLNKKPDKNDDKKYNAEYANKQIANSTVGILCYENEVTDIKDVISQGTGIIVTKDGYVVTNSHVIGNSKDKYKLQVVTSDDQKYTAGVVGFDTRTDLALLKLDDAKDLSPATFGNSEEISLGEEVIVIGNPGGIDYSNSITKGIISAVDRQISSTSNVKFIQTDAAINPGNSGGPVVNMYGQVIGIATAKIAAQEIEGMGFAIPSKTIKTVVDDLMKYSYVQGRVKIGILGTNVTSEGILLYNYPEGILVNEVVSDGPCDGSGIQENDIITSFNDNDVKSFADIYNLLEKCSPGDKVKISYYRPSNKETYTTEIVLQKADE